jgi:hypothetical protein
MPRHQPSENLRFAAGPERQGPIGPLGLPDLLDDLGALHQQIVHLVVQFVDAAA